MMANSDNGAFLFERVAASVAAEYGWKSFSHQLNSPMITVDLIARLQGPEAAVAWYKAKRSEGPDPGMSPYILNHVGYGLLLAGKLNDALKVLEANVEFYPEDSNAHDSLGEAYFKAGKKEAAIASYKKSLQLDPQNTNAVKMLEQLGVHP
jgi:tetratricopeptide (TPR) repeat protein